MKELINPIEQTIYEDFVHFKDNPEMLKDTFVLYVTSRIYEMGRIMNAKKRFETEFGINVIED